MPRLGPVAQEASTLTTSVAPGACGKPRRAAGARRVIASAERRWTIATLTTRGGTRKRGATTYRLGLSQNGLSKDGCGIREVSSHPPGATLHPNPESSNTKGAARNEPDTMLGPLASCSRAPAYTGLPNWLLVVLVLSHPVHGVEGKAWAKRRLRRAPPDDGRTEADQWAMHAASLRGRVRGVSSRGSLYRRSIVGIDHGRPEVCSAGKSCPTKGA